MHWKVSRHDPKTGAWKDILNNANITNIEALDVGEPGARVRVTGHRYSGTHGAYVEHRITLSADIIERAARKLGLIKEG
jgi:hypothetical protein